MIELRSIYKSFSVNADTMVLFNDFSFRVKKGEFVSIVGSNGSGKTTLLNLIAGTISPDKGCIYFNNNDITMQKEYIRARYIGRVFQDPLKGTAGLLTVAENLALAENKGKAYNLSPCLTEKRKERYHDLLLQFNLGLENKLDTPVMNLSGGQRQVLSILMATMTPIDLLILDEHTAALDPKTADRIMDITDKIVKEKGLTVLMVTHNLRYAVEYGNRLIMMHQGEMILDVDGEKKEKTQINDILNLFNSISIECGN